VLFGLPCLHNSDNHSVDNVLPFNSDFLVILLLSLVLAQFLLLVSRHRQELNSDVVIGESRVDLDFLGGSELGLLHVFFVQNLLFGVAQIEEGIVELAFRDGTMVLDFIIC
jgi:hypothetical protein